MYKWTNMRILLFGNSHDSVLKGRWGRAATWRSLCLHTSPPIYVCVPYKGGPTLHLGTVVASLTNSGSRNQILCEKQQFVFLRGGKCRRFRWADCIPNFPTIQEGVITIVESVSNVWHRSQTQRSRRGEENAGYFEWGHHRDFKIEVKS